MVPALMNSLKSLMLSFNTKYLQIYNGVKYEVGIENESIFCGSITIYSVLTCTIVVNSHCFFG